MSYTILYKRLFLRLRDNTYIGLVKAGSNNTYEYDLKGHEVRSRSWESWSFGTNKLSYTEEEINAFLEEEKKKCLRRSREDRIDDREALSHFGWWRSVALYGKGTATTSYASFRNFFLGGLQSAITFEEHCRFFGSIRLLCWDEEKHDFNRTDSINDEDTLREQFAALRKDNPSETIYAVPSGRHLIDSLLSLKPSVRGKGTLLGLSYQTEDGTLKSGYLKTLLPLSVVPDNLSATSFSQSFDDGVFHLISHVMKKYGYDLRCISHTR